MRRSLAIMLRREGFQVTEAGSVADAGRRLKGEPYNLVIADLRMEPLNGFDLLMLARRYCPLQAGDLQSRIYRLLGADGR
jgi:DNA-binding response OmpR family regulator